MVECPHNDFCQHFSTDCRLQSCSVRLHTCTSRPIPCRFGFDLSTSLPYNSAHENESSCSDENPDIAREITLTSILWPVLMSISIFTGSSLHDEVLERSLPLRFFVETAVVVVWLPAVPATAVVLPPPPPLFSTPCLAAMCWRHKSYTFTDKKFYFVKMLGIVMEPMPQTMQLPDKHQSRLRDRGQSNRPSADSYVFVVQLRLKPTCPPCRPPCKYRRCMFRTPNVTSLEIHYLREYQSAAAVQRTTLHFVSSNTSPAVEPVQKFSFRVSFVV